MQKLDEVFPGAFVVGYFDSEGKAKFEIKGEEQQLSYLMKHLEINHG